MKNPIIIFMEWVDQTLFATAGKISPWLMPIPSGLILGWTFGVNMIDKWGGPVAQTAGWCATAGVVGLGAYASHNAVKRGGAWWGLVAGHALLVILSFLILDAEAHVKGIGIILELMTVLSYVASAGARKTDEEKQQQAAAENKAELTEAEKLKQDFDLRREEMRLEHERKLAQIEANKQARIAKATVQPSVQSTVQLDAAADDKSRQKDEILSILLNSQRLNISHLAEQWGVSRNTVYGRLSDLEADGLIHKNGDGWKANQSDSGAVSE